MTLTLIGRDHPAEILRGQVVRATESQGGLTLVTGEAGIGKTALVTGALEDARQLGALVLSGSCWDSASAPGYWPWTQVIRALRRSAEPEEWAAAEQAGGSRLSVLLGECPSNEKTESFQLYDAVTTALVTASQSRPLVVVLEDLHWADPASLRLLEFAARHAWSERLLVVGTYRDVEVESPDHPLRELLLPLQTQATTVTLTGLGAAETGALMARTVGRQPAENLVAEVHRRTGGNPFFVEQTARLWHGGGTVTAIAPGVREAVRRRLSLLPEPVVRLLSGAAVLGREFHRQVLAATVEAPVPQVDRLLEQAVTARLVTVLRGGRFSFSHDLVRETLNATLEEGESHRRHAAVVRAALRSPGLRERLLPAELARHAVLAGGELDPSQTIDLLIAAAEDAGGRLAVEEAVGHLRGAFELAVGVDPRRPVLVGLHFGAELHRIGGLEEAQRVFTDIVDRVQALDDPELLARVALTRYTLSPTSHREPDVVALLREAYRQLVAEEGNRGRQGIWRYRSPVSGGDPTAMEGAPASTRDPFAPGSLAPGSLGPDPLGLDPLGLDPLVSDPLVPDALSPGLPSPDLLGPDPLGPDHRAPDTRGPGPREPDLLGPDLLRPVGERSRLPGDAYPDDADRCDRKPAPSNPFGTPTAPCTVWGDGGLSWSHDAEPDRQDRFTVDQLAVRLATLVTDRARQAGDDEVLIFGLWTQHNCLTGPGHAAVRAALTRELVAAGRRSGDRQTAYLAASFQWVALVEQGDPRYLDQYHEFAALADRAGHPLSHFSSSIDRCVIATLRGRLDEAEELLDRAVDMFGEHQRLRMASMAAHLSWAIRLHRGRYDDPARLYRTLTDVGHPGAALLAGITAVCAGQVDVARRYRAELLAHPDPPGPALLPLWLRFQAELAAADDDRELGARARAGLRPFAGQWGVALYGCDVIGPTDLWLALLDASEGRWDAAVEGFTAAWRSADRLGARLWSLEARERLARARLARYARGRSDAADGDGSTGSTRSTSSDSVHSSGGANGSGGADRSDAEEAAALLAGVEREAEELGATHLVRRARAVRTPPATPPAGVPETRTTTGDAPTLPPSGPAAGADRPSTSPDGEAAPPARQAGGEPSAARPRFRFDGAVWSLSYAGRTVPMPDAKGLRDLHLLLSRPHTDVPAVQLLNPEGGAEAVAARSLGGDPVLDEEAKRQYRLRLERLDEEIDRATVRGEPDRAAAFDREREALVAELRTAAGLGGRDRRLGDEAERARKTVSARIRDTLRRLDRRHPELAAHLRSTISTGANCRYAPEQ